MKRFSVGFWLIVWPTVTAASHVGLLCSLVWLFPGKGEPGISMAFTILYVLLWPWFVGVWIFGPIGGIVGLPLAFLWLPAIAFWITWRKVKKTRTPNQDLNPIEKCAHFCEG